MAAKTFDVEQQRKHFPALEQDQVFFDNAGGSQTLGTVADTIHNYLLTTNVQLGATYKASHASTTLYTAGLAAASSYVHAAPSETVLGSSTTQLFRNLAVSFLPYLSAQRAARPDSPPELVLSALDHEANIASWLFLAATLHLPVKWWYGDLGISPEHDPSSPADPGLVRHGLRSRSPRLTPESLVPLLSPRTFLVACTHTSNILGSITPVRAVADAVHNTHPGAHTLFVVDGVAFAPHRPLDLPSLGVDVYCFSWYKVYGPHLAQMYVRKELAERGVVASLGHYFKSGATLEERLGLAGASYELVAALPGVTEYLCEGENGAWWQGVAKHEEKIQEVLLGHLRAHPETYAIYGESSADAALRVPVVAFTVKGRGSKELVEAMEGRRAERATVGPNANAREHADVVQGLNGEVVPASAAGVALGAGGRDDEREVPPSASAAGPEGTKYGFRWGHFYSKRLVDGVYGLGEDGIIRVSMVHYNTVAEIEGFVKELEEEVFGKGGNAKR